MSKRTKAMAVVALGMVGFSSATGCSDSFLLRTGVKMADPFVEGPTAEGRRFERVSGRVYSAKLNWYRNLVIDTPEGVVVIDPMGGEMVDVVRRGIAEKLERKPVHTLIYSHYHLDHVRGGAMLAPKVVIGHEKCTHYWGSTGASDVLPITRPITGDETIIVGGVEIQALYLGHSHSDTLYAFYLPAEKLLFTADLGLVRTVPPMGVPDSYWPGYSAALDRVAALDFETFVPSHFDVGTKQDLLDYIELMRLSRSLARQSLAKRGSINSGTKFEAYFDDIYPVLQPKYGNWHGFTAMFIANIVRDIAGESLGY